MKSLQFEDLPKAMAQVLEKLDALEQVLNHIQEKLQPKEPEELMTRQEVAAYFKVDLSTVWKWSKKGTLTTYGVQGRVYYKRSEIEGALIQINYANRNVMCH